MSITESLQRVGCVSEFEDRDIDEGLLAGIVEATAWAPSAANAQPWEIIAVRSAERKAAIVETLLDSHLRPHTGGGQRRSWVAAAAVLLVVCLDHTRAKARYGEIGERLFGVQDTGAAIQNMRLVAQEQGIKSCLVREFDRGQMARLLSLPRHVEPLIMIALGYSDVEPKPLPRLPLEDVLHREAW